MNEKKLFLEKRGCDFFAGDEISLKSNVGNYRVVCNNIVGKNGRNYFLEFTRGFKISTRKINKRNGRPLVHPVREKVNDCALHLDSCYPGKEFLQGDRILDQYVWESNLTYTIENILKVVNLISKDKYISVEFI